MTISCQTCGKSFYASPNKVAKGFSKFCSKPCSSVPRRTGSQKTCHFCGKGFYVKSDDVKRRPCNFCSRKCRYAVSLTEQVWIRVNKSDSCWLWTGSKASGGYGVINHNKQRFLIHRLTWKWTYGPIPNGLYVLHRCDNPPCIRPSHLFLGTHEDNMRDMVKKKRHRWLKGSHHLSSKLTETAVTKIREARGKISTADLIQVYGVTDSTINKAQIGLTWKHIPFPKDYSPIYIRGKKLTENKVREILGLKGKASAKDVATLFMVSEPLIYQIWRKTVWTHVTP